MLVPWCRTILSASELIRKRFVWYDIPFAVAPGINLTLALDFNLLLSFQTSMSFTIESPGSSVFNFFLKVTLTLLSFLFCDGDVILVLPLLILSCQDDLILVLPLFYLSCDDDEFWFYPCCVYPVIVTNVDVNIVIFILR